MATKYVFVTGGVVSGLGKGLSAASLAAFLTSPRLRPAKVLPVSAPLPSPLPPLGRM